MAYSITMATNTMITIKDVQINSLNLYYTEELTALKAEAVSQAEKMHAAGDYTAAAEYSTMAGKISDELTARGETPAAIERGTMYNNLNKVARIVEALHGRLAIVPEESPDDPHCQFIEFE